MAHSVKNSKSQIPTSNDQKELVSDFGDWDLFGFWCLGFGASITLCAMRSASRAVSSTCLYTDTADVVTEMEGF
jgi:hypothetical protein